MQLAFFYLAVRNYLLTATVKWGDFDQWGEFNQFELTL